MTVASATVIFCVFRHRSRKLSYFRQLPFTLRRSLLYNYYTFAHIGALKANGRTIAVLAHGLNKIYPPQNRELAIQILKHNGTIISEYSISEIMKKENFERRNRIISGLSSKTIVVEAAIKSGALITANYAMEQGRSVIAVPGNIDSKYSQGTNKLLKIGAEIYL